MIDNFCFEDDVEIKLEIPTQPFNNELSEISELFSNPSCERYLHAGYLPIGFFEDEAYILCLDTCMDGIFIKYFDYEECLDFDTREELESSALVLFDSFEDFMSCFFERKKYDAAKCDDYNN